MRENSTNQERVMTSCHGGEACTSSRREFLRELWVKYFGVVSLSLFFFAGDRIEEKRFVCVKERSCYCGLLSVARSQFESSKWRMK